MVLVGLNFHLLSINPSIIGKERGLWLNFYRINNGSKKGRNGVISSFTYTELAVLLCYLQASLFQLLL